MKWYVLVTLILAALLCSSGCTNTDSGEVIRVGVGENFPPWSYPDENGEYTGFAVDTIRMIAEQGGKQVEIIPLPWTNITDNAANGTVDVVFGGLTITPERAESVDFTIPYVYVNRAAATGTDSNLTLEDLMSGRYRIATATGGTTQTWLLEYVGGDIYPMPTIGDAFEELENRNVDAVIYDETSVNRYIRSGSFKKAGVIPIYAPHAGAVRIGNTGLLDFLNDGITAMKTSPEWHQLFGIYNVPYN